MRERDGDCRSGKKIVGGDGFDSVWCEYFRGKVPQVLRKNELRAALERRRQDMTVVRVYEIKFEDRLFVHDDDCFGKSHQNVRSCDFTLSAISE